MQEFSYCTPEDGPQFLLGGCVLGLVEPCLDDSDFPDNELWLAAGGETL